MESQSDLKKALDEVTARWAKDEQGEVAWCGQKTALLQALEAGERRVELGGINDAELSSCVKEICQALALGRIDQLSFAQCGLSETHLGELTDALLGSRLQALGIAGARDLPLGAWNCLWEALPLTITKLDFGENHFLDEALADLCRALGKQEREALEELFLDENHFTTVDPVIEVLPALPELSWLDVGDNRLDDSAVFRLCDSLPSTKLSCLVLGTNNITGAAASRLFATLASMPSMEMLYLDHTGTDDEALKMLGTMIDDVSLKELHLDATRISDRGVRELCMLLARSSIDFLDVSDNNLSDATVALVKEVLGMDNIVVEDVETEEDDKENQKDVKNVEQKATFHGEDEVDRDEDASSSLIQTAPKEGRGSTSRVQGKGSKKGKGQGTGGYAGDGGSSLMEVDEK